MLSENAEKICTDIIWQPGPPGWVVLNTDGLIRPMIGLNITWEAGYRKVWACVNSKVVLGFLHSPGAPTHQHAAEISSLRKALERDWDVSLSHTYREGNKAA
ncbi:hypothetical protein LINPERPRIM_LOCUS18751, partial [Linum perenne]